MARRNVRELLEQLREEQSEQSVQLRAELTALLAQQIAAGQPPAAETDPLPPAPKSSVKTRLPDSYEPGKTDLRQWLFQMDNYFTMTGAAKIERVPCASQLFRGAAMSWYMGLLSQISAPGSTVPAITGWADVKQRLMAHFASVNPEKEARVKLDTLKQAHSVQDYITRFNKLAMDIPSMTQTEMIYRFEQGLKPRVQAEVARSEFTSLSDLFAAAQRFDAITWRDKPLNDSTNSGRNNNNNNRNNGKPKVPQTFNLAAMNLTQLQTLLQQPTATPQLVPKAKKAPRPPKQDTPAPLQAAAVQPASPALNKLTQQEREHLRANNGCFRCRQLGHMASACPNFATPPQGNAQRR